MKIYRITYLSVIAMFLTIAASAQASAQAMSNYAFTPSSGTFTELSGATVQTLADGSTDDGILSGCVKSDLILSITV